MKILLVQPAGRSYVITPNLGLGYLAAVARLHGHEVSVLDCVKEGMDHDGFAEYLRRNPFDLVGFQLFSYSLDSVQRHLSDVRRLAPGAVSLCGGPHPSGDPEGTLEYLKDLDFAIQGEGEPGLPILLHALESGTSVDAVPGLLYRKGGGIVRNAPAFVEDLDSLPLPAWDLLAPETYPEAPHGAFSRKFPVAPIIITRGCPCHCTFCAGKTVSGARLRKRSVSNVFAELHLLAGRGIREFHIEDENFTLDRGLVLEFCDALEESGLDLSWSVPAGVRIDTLDAVMLDRMERVRCYSLGLGIEFGSDRMLVASRKGFTVETIRRKTSLFRGSGIRTTGFFLLGMPGESLKEMRETASFARELPIDRAQFNNFIPLPGSDMWNGMKREGKLGSIRWSDFHVHAAVSYNDEVPASGLRALQRSAYLRFYLRPRILFRVLGEIRSFRQAWHLLRRLMQSIL